MTSNQLSVKPEKVKLPGPLAAKGRVTLTLTDADTGVVVDKIEKNNFIAKGMEKLYMVQMKHLFQRSKFTGGISADILGNPFRTMWLTDADHDEDPENEWIMKGKVIGEAFTYTDLKGNKAGISGTYNAVESFTDEDQVRIVVDFGADEANGDINSVYFGSDQNVLPQGSQFGWKTIGPYTYSGNFEHHIDKWYGRTTNSSNSISLFNDDFEFIKSYSIENSSYYDHLADLTIYDDHIYAVVYRQSGNFNRWRLALVKIPLSDLYGLEDSGIVEDYYLITQDSNERGITSIVYMDDRNQFATFEYNKRNIIQIRDTDLNILDTFDIGYNYKNYLLYSDGHLIDDEFVVNVENGVVTPRSNPAIGVAISTSAIDVKNGLLVDGNARIVPLLGFASRARLDRTVTKTTRYNMKVVYDFMLPSIYPSSI